METVYFKGTPFHTYGTVPEAGSKAPDFKLVTKDLQEVTLADFAGKKLVLNVFPSLDTPVCAASVRRFNQEAAKLDDVAVLLRFDGPPICHGSLLHCRRSRQGDGCICLPFA